MGRKHLFIMDPIEKLNISLDSSLRLAAALQERGDTLHCCETRHLAYDSRLQEGLALTRTLTVDPHQFTCQVGFEKITELKSFDSIQMRKDPPVDRHYLEALWVLDLSSTRVINAPLALMRYDEKLLTLKFPEFCKKGVVGREATFFKNFAQGFQHPHGIAKPLGWFGGKGVFDVDTTSSPFSNTESWTETTHLLQEFDESIYQGEVRCFTAGGKDVAWCLKKPRQGSYLANTAAGATLEPFEPSQKLVSRVNHVSSALLKEGIFFIGFDIIGNEISEINITSPRLLLPTGQDFHAVYRKIAEMI